MWYTYLYEISFLYGTPERVFMTVEQIRGEMINDPRADFAKWDNSGWIPSPIDTHTFNPDEKEPKMERQVGEKFYYKPDNVWLEVIEGRGCDDCYCCEDELCNDDSVFRNSCCPSMRKDNKFIQYRKTHLTTSDIKKLKLQIHVPDDDCKRRLSEMLDEQGVVWGYSGNLPTSSIGTSQYYTVDSDGLLQIADVVDGYKQLSVQEYNEKFYDHWRNGRKTNSITFDEKEPAEDLFKRLQEKQMEKQAVENKQANYLVIKTDEDGVTGSYDDSYLGASDNWEQSNLSPNTTYVLSMEHCGCGVFCAVPRGLELVDLDEAKGVDGARFLDYDGDWMDRRYYDSVCAAIPKTTPKKQALLDELEALEQKAKELDEQRKALRAKVEEE